MNRNRKEELLTRWMDDALGEEELRELQPIIEAHPELEREREEYARIRAGMREVMPPDREPPYPEFFNSHLECKVREAMRSAAKPGWRGISWGRLVGWWLAPAATAAVVIAFLAGMKVGRPAAMPGAASLKPVPPTVYSPMGGVRAEAHLDDELDATVIVLSGLEELSDVELSWDGRVFRGAREHMVRLMGAAGEEGL